MYLFYIRYTYSIKRMKNHLRNSYTNNKCTQNIIPEHTLKSIPVIFSLLTVLNESINCFSNTV